MSCVYLLIVLFTLKYLSLHGVHLLSLLQCFNPNPCRYCFGSLLLYYELSALYITLYCMIWLQAMLTSCSPILGWSNIGIGILVYPVYSCAVNWASSPSWTVFLAALCFLLPVIFFCYMKIARVAQHHSQTIHSLQQHFQHSRGHPIISPLKHPTSVQLWTWKFMTHPGLCTMHVGCLC